MNIKIEKIFQEKEFVFVTTFYFFFEKIYIYSKTLLE